MEQTLWTTRTFNFDFPAGMFPVIIARLRGTYPRIKDLIQNIPPEDLIKQFNNKWSIQQQIGHLIDLEELHTGRIIDFRNNEGVLRAADMANKKTVEGNHNTKRIEDLMKEFYEGRNQFINELLKFSDNALSRTALHPRLNQQMRVVDMAYFVAEHDDSHIARMWEIKEKLSK